MTAIPVISTLCQTNFCLCQTGFLCEKALKKVMKRVCKVNRCVTFQKMYGLIEVFWKSEVSSTVFSVNTL